MVPLPVDVVAQSVGQFAIVSPGPQKPSMLQHPLVQSLGHV
jgi:hypothetical protein